MKKKATLLSIATLVVSMASTAGATVLDFEGLITSDSGPIPAGYGGFTWNSTYLLSDNSYTGAWGNTYGSPSGEYAAFSSGDDDGTRNKTVTSSVSFDFTGAYFTGWAENDLPMGSTAASLIINGYNGATLVDSTIFGLPTDAYSWVQVDFIGVTKLEFLTPEYPDYWLMDDFTYNESQIPEPTTLALMGIGLAGIGFARKKKQS